MIFGCRHFLKKANKIYKISESLNMYILTKTKFSWQQYYFEEIGKLKTYMILTEKIYFLLQFYWSLVYIQKNDFKNKSIDFPRAIMP